MLETILQYLNNYFIVWGSAHKAEYMIQDGGISLDFLLPNQYFMVSGSVFNNGVHQYTDSMELTDETFTGTIYALAIPPSLLKLVSEIEEWQEKYGKVVSSPFTSESVTGTYSYTKASGGDSGNALSWQNVFGNRLNTWKRV